MLLKRNAKKEKNTVSLFMMLFLMCCVFDVSGSDVFAQDDIDLSVRERSVRVFLDVSRRYQEYVKIEIPYVNYVRDRNQAQVHVMMTRQETGSGGREYTITFTGLQDFDAVNDTLICTSRQMDTDEIVRIGIVKTIKMGLMRYVSRTPVAEDIVIDYSMKAEPEEVVDKWNYWVFTIDTDSRLDGEESKQSLSLEGAISADRVTPHWKTSFSLGAEYEKERYETDDGWYDSHTRSQDFRSLVVKSVSGHWSVGGYGSARTSSYRNIDFSYTVAPAIEFNVFPYAESTYREFRFLYRLDYTSSWYLEETVYDKMDENLFEENLTATYEIKERWGSIETALEGSHYFHDTSINQVELRCNIDIRLMEGLSLDLYGRISQIHDQISLPKEGATEEEILLNLRELKTQYDYRLSIGLRYTFGSIYSNVVNPRFGNGN